MPITDRSPSPILVTEQLRTASAMLAGGAWSLVPPTLRRLVDPTDEVVVHRADTGSDRLLDAYAAWAGAPPDRYRDTVPPHSLARWAMPTIARLTAKAPIGLLGVLNQGVHVRVLQSIPRRMDLEVEGRLAGVVEVPGRTRIDTELEVRLPDGTPAMRIDVHAVVPDPDGQRVRRPRAEEATWERVGSFATEREDGKRFFLLTGDPNPLHTLETVGRLTRFDGCIAHGFGTLARTWEQLVDAGHEVTDIDVRFVAPNPLPNPELVVERAVTADEDGRRRVRTRGADGTVHLAGTLA